MGDHIHWLDAFPTFGDLLKYLRIRAGLTQRDLSIAVRYSEAQICRLESNKRVPHPDALLPLFVPALGLEDEPETITRLLELAGLVQKPERVTTTSHQEQGYTLQIGVLKKRHNLPGELTSLVGREADLAKVAHLLQLPSTRLLTLTGVGGCGKTRLALRTGRDLSENYQHGVWLVELAPLSNPTLVPQAICSALGLMVNPKHQTVDVLKAFFLEHTILLILDNCEHLVDGVAQLVTDLLSTCSGLQILATSRELLNVPGETSYRVHSLVLPPTDESAVIRRYAAVRLFLERANNIQPGYILAEREAPSLARICRRLDGIPLALELAAAQVNALTVSEIADRLDEGFNVLRPGGRGRIPRHATLHATVEWSYNLLTAPEQALLRRLSIFAGGWSLEQAEEVCAKGELEQERVLDHLVSLVNKSQVVVDQQPTLSTRYRLHEMVRQYARERLVEAGEEDDLCHRFLDCFLRLAEEIEPELKGPQQIAWLACLDKEQDNFKTALNIAIVHHNVLAALRLSAAFVYYWILRGRHNEGLRWLKEAIWLQKTIPLTETMTPCQIDILRARAQVLTGIIALSSFPIHTEHAGSDIVRECQQIYRAMEDHQGLAYMYTFLDFHTFSDTPEEYGTWYSELQAFLPEILAAGDHWTAAQVLQRLGEWAWESGNFPVWRKYGRECITQMRVSGDQIFLAILEMRGAWLDWDQGNIIKARDTICETLRTLDEAGLFYYKAEAHSYLGIFYAALGDFDRAYESFNECIRIYRAIGAFWALPIGMGCLSEAYFFEGQLVEAKAKLERSISMPEDFETAWVTGMYLLRLGQILFYENDLNGSAQMLARCLELFEREGNSATVFIPLRTLGLIRLSQGDLIAARDLLHRAQAEIFRNGCLPDFPLTLDALAQLSLAEGNTERAARLLGASDSLMARMAMVRYPVYQSEYRRCREVACLSLGEESFAVAYSTGKHLAAGTSAVNAITSAF